MKKGLRIIAVVLAVILLVAGGYVAYVFISYHRLPDADEVVDGGGKAASAGEEYAVVTWNLGFGAYSADYSFFMDGGTRSRAYSAQAVRDNLAHAAALLKAQPADFMLLQELDTDATRSHHVDEVELVGSALPEWQLCYAQNYDSPYLFYPLLEPHGASKSGIVTLSDRGINRFARVSLPVESGFMKLLDLDRCYSKAYIPVDNGRTLCLYNLHLSAYTSDGAIATRQLEVLTADMLAEYQAGNYVVAGGDFNKDLLGDSGGIFGVSGEDFNWAQPLPGGAIPEGFSLVDSLDAEDPVPSCRNSDIPYQPGVSFVLTCDGFIVSDNVKALSCTVIDDGFAVSDHNPVRMTFELME